MNHSNLLGFDCMIVDYDDDSDGGGDDALGDHSWTEQLKTSDD